MSHFYLPPGVPCEARLIVEAEQGKMMSVHELSIFSHHEFFAGIVQKRPVNPGRPETREILLIYVWISGIDRS